MISLVYVSSAVVPFTSDELVKLLDQSRTNNERIEVTGMLVYKEGNFMQVLEGDEMRVDGLVKKIGRDPRQCGMIVLSRTPITERSFPHWSMGFRDLKSEEVRAMPGYDEFLNDSLVGEAFLDHPSRGQKLLLNFRKTM